MWNSANVISDSNQNPKDNLTYQIEEVSKGILNILTDVMGPHATFAAIPKVSQLGNQTSTEFTKDGIGIVSKILYKDNKIANSILSSIEHIGQRVDTKCHDGTTTSMYIFVSLLCNLKKLASQSKSLEFKYALSNVFKYINNVLERNTVPIEKICEDLELPRDKIREHIAYAQSMVATKGSRRLSKVVTDYINNVPIEDLYSFTTMDHVLIEDNGDDVELLFKEYDIQIPINKMDQTVNNYLYNREYKGEIDLIPIEESLIRGNEKSKEIEKEIDECIEILDQKEVIYDNDQVFIREEKDLFILALNVSDEMSKKIEILNNLLKFHNKKGRVRVCILRKTVGDYINLHTVYIRAIRLMSGIDIFDCNDCYFRDCIISNINIHAIDHNLHVRYNKEKSDNLYTSKYLNEQNSKNVTPYGRLLKQIKNVLDISISSRNQKLFENKELIAHNEILKSIICEKNAVIHIDGTSHSIQTDMSTLQDAIGSVTSSIKDGVIYGGIVRFYAILENKITTTENITNLEREILIEFKKTFENIIKIIYKEDAVDILFKDNLDLTSRFIRQYSDLYFSQYYYIDPDTQKFTIIEHDKEKYKNITPIERNNTVLVQPSSMFEEMFFRIEEILPKYLLTKNYIL